MSELSRELIDSLFPAALPSPAELEQRYPPRGLPHGAEVTRFAPSPTGSMHIGGVFTGSVAQDIARHSGGVYLVRVEDTDRTRFDAGSADQFAQAFAYFGIEPDESDAAGTGKPGCHGPYTQSARADIYLTYVRELMRRGLAYPCFASKDELAQIAASQKAAGALPGYYGEWATWRDAPSEQVRQRLDAGDPFVVRFRSPGLSRQRVTFTDKIRGPISIDDNRNDVVILKSSDSPLRLPTYHLAHAVDDHLMRITLVTRSEEWLPSVPLHHQLFDALEFERIPYAHLSPLMKQDKGSRRKLSKRHDPEASVSFYIEQGFPVEAVQYYLRGIANARLADLPLREALAEPLRLSEFGTAGPLVDMVKLDDICADFIASLPAEDIITRMLSWSDTYDQALAQVLRAQRPLALRALSVERGDGVANPRKDLRKWSDFRGTYGFFFPEVFTLVTDPADPRFGALPPNLVQQVAIRFADSYAPPGPDSDWFGQVRTLAASLGFAASQKIYKKDPDAYPGSIADVSAVIRVLLTGSRQSPNLEEIAAALGTDEVLRRVRAIT
jgi:glutamyl-tRNA synthetase